MPWKKEVEKKAASGYIDVGIYYEKEFETDDGF
jgi:hypothetical protein